MLFHRYYSRGDLPSVKELYQHVWLLVLEIMAHLRHADITPWQMEGQHNENIYLVGDLWIRCLTRSTIKKFTFFYVVITFDPTYPTVEALGFEKMVQMLKEPFQPLPFNLDQIYFVTDHCWRDFDRLRWLLSNIMPFIFVSTKKKQDKTGRLTVSLLVQTYDSTGIGSFVILASVILLVWLPW